MLANFKSTTIGPLQKLDHQTSSLSLILMVLRDGTLLAKDESSFSNDQQMVVIITASVPTRSAFETNFRRCLATTSWAGAGYKDT